MSVSVSILAAGHGKRMHSDKPKVLHELAGWPMVRYVLKSRHKSPIARLFWLLGTARVTCVSL